MKTETAEPANEPPKVLENKTREELKTLAMDMFKEKIFSDWHIPQEDFNHMVGSIFMPIGLGGINDEFAHQIGLAYEYLSEAGPRSINGYPSFFSVKFLNKDDSFRLFKLHQALKKFPDVEPLDQVLDKADLEIIEVKKEHENATTTG